jgi:cytosine/adenosine deaminase-related metal-dependent hydrolase
LYRKFTADHIFTGRSILDHPAVLVTDPAGTVVDLLSPADAGGDIEQFRGILTPGFINAHCHLELSHLEGLIRGKEGLVKFVQQVMERRASTAELKLEAMMRAEAAMWSSGIVAVGDICNTIDSAGVKEGSRMLWHNFIELTGFTDVMAASRMEFGKQVLEHFQAGPHQERNSFSPHAPYSVSRSLFGLINEATQGQLISIHNQESAEEDLLYQYKNGLFLELYRKFSIDISGFQPTGRSSLKSWLPCFDQGQQILSVHNSFISGDDLAFAEGKPALHGGLYYCICINANLYIENRIPPVHQLAAMQGRVVIGTDSLASNDQLDILEEIKSIQRETAHEIPLGEILQWATINGARALRMDDAVGSFEPGKRPGVVLIEKLDGLRTTQNSKARRLL